MKLLQVLSSMNGEKSTSSQLASVYAQEWKKKNPTGEIITRDLYKDQIPHLSAEVFQSFFTPAPQRTAQQNAWVAKSDGLIDEIQDADAILVTAPLYNLNAPTQLSAWIDQVVRSGVSFKYTAQGPVGLLKNKPLTIISTRGGYYKSTPFDTLSPYLNNIFRFVGINDLRLICAEGLDIDPDHRERNLAAAREEILSIFRT